MYEIKLFNKEDKEKIIEFNKLVHEEDSIVAVVNNIMFNNPFNSLDNFAYMEDEGKIIATVGLIPHKQRFGSKEVEVSEIGLVGTHPEYRKKGLCTELMNYFIDYMKNKEIPLCYLFGIPNFYQQFGFEYASPVHFYNYVTIEKQLLKNIKGKYKIEKLNAEDNKSIEKIKNIYDKFSEQNFCSKVRSLEYFNYRIKTTNHSEYKWFLIKDDESIKGYLWMSKTEKEITIREAHILDNEAGNSLCEFIYSFVETNSLAEEKEEIKTIGMKAPLNNSFSKFLYKKGSRFACTSEIYPGSWGGMYKIINLQKVLEMLTESFEQRIKNSRFYDFIGNYRIVTDIDNEICFSTLVIDNSKVSISDDEIEAIEVNIPINILTSIFTGYKDISYYEDKIKLDSKEDYELFKILFPMENPYIWDLEYSDVIEYLE